MHSMNRFYTTLFLLLTVLTANAFELGALNKVSLDSKSLFVANASLDASANVVLWTETDVPAQRWLIATSSEGKVSLQNAYSGYFLGVASLHSNVVARQKAYSSSTCQWVLKPVEGKKNTYQIFDGAQQAYCLAVQSTTDDGALLKLVEASSAVDSLSEFVIESAYLSTSFNIADREAMITGYMNQYYHKASTGHVLGGGGWWGDAEMFETLLDCFATTGDLKYKTYFHELYTNFLSRNGTDWTNNEFNDDITWMVLACVRAYKYFGVADYLTKAKTNFDNMYARAKQQFGTLIWKQSQSNKRSTNSCINCPATIAACYLAQATGDDTYYEKALSIYTGQRKLLFEPSTGHVYDSGSWNADGTVGSNPNKWASTYNQGTMLGAALQLYRHTHDESYKQDAEKIYEYSFGHLTDQHHIINVCQNVNGDFCGFKGILMRYVRMYAEDLRHEDELAFLEKNAFHAFQNRNSKGVSWSAWLTKTDEQLKRVENNENKDVSNDAFGGSTAVSAAFNAHINRVFQKDAFSEIGAAAFDDIQFTQISDTQTDGQTPETVGNALTNGYLCFKNVSFGSNVASHLLVRAYAGKSRSRIVVYVDSLADNCKIATSAFLKSKTWADYDLTLDSCLTGTHDIYVQFVNTGIQFHYMRFTSASYLTPDLTDNGGTLTVVPENTVDGSKLIDNNPTTGVSFDTNTVTLTYHSTAPLLLKGYALCPLPSAPAASLSLLLEGSNDSTSWKQLDRQTAHTSQGAKAAFDLNAGETYDFFRLTIVSDQPALALADWQLYGSGLMEGDITDDGGQVAVSPDNASAALLTDNKVSTALSQAASSMPSFVYKAQKEYVLSGYSITNAAKTTDSPVDWKLYGSNNGKSWILIDERNGQKFLYPEETEPFVIEQRPNAFSQYKIAFSGAAGDTLSLSEIQLWGDVNYGTFYNDVTANHGTLTASDGSDAQLLIDNDGTTVASVKGDTLYWQYDSPFPITYLGLSMVSGSDLSKAPQRITVYASQDGAAWSKIHTVSPAFSWGGQRCTKLFSDMDYSHYRLVVNEVADGGDEAQLAEWELIGTGISKDASISVPVKSCEPSAANALCNFQSAPYTTSFASPFEVTYQLNQPVAIGSYGLTSGTATNCDPKAWTLMGSVDGNDYVVLDTQQDMAFAARKCTQYYDVSDTTAYQYYRLCVTEVNGSSDISLGEWQLFSRLSTGIIPVHAQGSEMRLEGDKLSVSGAAGSQLRVYTLDGILEQHTTLKGSRCRLTLRPGWHLCVLTNGRMKAVRKVYVLR